MSWRKRPKLENLGALLDLARDKSNTSREILMATITDLFDNTGQILSESERILSEDILRRLIEEVEISIRQALSERLSALPNAPKPILMKLADDDISVALPILKQSTVLQDSDLIEIVRQKSMGHRLAIAMRKSVSENLSDSLIDCKEDQVVVTLLRNDGAKFHPVTMSSLVSEAREKEEYQEPLLRRRDLDPVLARRMFWWVSAALRTHILDNFKVDAATLDDAMEGAVHDIVGDDQPQTFDAKEAEVADPDSNVESLEELLANSDVAGDRLVAQLRQGEVAAFQSALGRKAGLRPTLLNRLIYEQGGEGLAIICRAQDMSPKIFSAIYRMTREATEEGSKLARGELVRITALYLDIQPDLARDVLRNWRRDPNYLWAIKQVTGGA
ncbi:MAG: DUF2336 domain-containing protein [Alphaproteobacteria bacterium]|nr:DUF2336 domain-containing protein [Alphaproteobacteria bacterium]